MPWLINNPRVLYHGTTLPAANNIVQNGVNLGVGKADTDFGQAFYVTTSEHQAREWANTRCQPWTGPNPNKIAAVIRFGADWVALSRLDYLAFVWEGANQGSDYWDFTEHCRKGGVHRPQGGSFDVVYGPVRIWPQQLVIANADQISFHTTKALAALGSAVLYQQGTLADPFVR